MPTSSHTTVSDVRIEKHSVQVNPGLGNRYTGTGQVPPRGHQSSLKTASSSEHINVSRTDTAQGLPSPNKTALNFDQTIKMNGTPLPKIPSSETQKARPLVDEADHRQIESRRSLDKTIETKNEQIPGHMSSTKQNSFELNDETMRKNSGVILPPIENTHTIDQSDETTKTKKKKKKRKHHKNKVSAESDPQNDTTENQSMKEMENQEDGVGNLKVAKRARYS